MTGITFGSTSVIIVLNAKTIAGKMLSSIHYPRSGQKSERKKYYPGETTEDPFSVFIEHRLESATNVQKLQRSLKLDSRVHNSQSLLLMAVTNLL